MRTAEALRKYREAKGLTLEEISEKTGIPMSTISGWERGANAPRRGNLSTLLDFYGVDMDDFLEDTGQQSNARIVPPEAGLRWVPVVSYAQAGTIAGDYQDLCNQIDERVETDCRAENSFAVRVIGDSMEPEAFDGDLAIINPNTEAQSGRPAIVRIRDTGETMLKWYFRSGERGEKIMLGSENPSHATLNFVADEIEWAYPVHAIRRQPRTRRAQDFLKSKQEPRASNSETRPLSSARNK